MPSTWPAARNTIGMIEAMPAPRHAKPTSAAAGVESASAAAKPTAPTRPPRRTNRTPAARASAAAAQEPHAAGVRHEPVAGEPAECHRHRERGEAERGEAGAGA